MDSFEGLDSKQIRRIEHREVEVFAQHLLADGFGQGILDATRSAVQADFAPQSIAMALVSFEVKQRKGYPEPKALGAIRIQQFRTFGKDRTG